MSSAIETPVLIVGGGPVGFALALALGLKGDRSTLVEQDHGTGVVVLAKAGTINERTMEICRGWGIADRVANFGFPDDFPRDTVYCTSLNGFMMGRDPSPSTRDRVPPPQSPEILRKAPQFAFDPMIAQAAQETGNVTVRYNSRFERFTQDADGVTSELTDVATGKAYQIRSQYLVGCDGAGSVIRKGLGIPFPGPDLGYSVSAMVRAPDLYRYHPLGKAERYMFVGTNGTWANLTSVDQRDLWRFTVIGLPKGEPLTMEKAAEEFRRAVGREAPFEIVRLMPWRRSQCTADSYNVGRVVLAGDAAHTTSPTGGHGLNTGIGDIASLSWMLDAILKGWGGPHMLEAYGLERRPVAIRNGSVSTTNFHNWVAMADFGRVLEDTPEAEAIRQDIGRQFSASLYQEWFSLGVAMGYRYDTSPLVVPDGTPPTPDEVTEYVQTARPGHRAPHAFLADGRSTIDLFGKGFVLLRFGAAPPDGSPLLAAAQKRHVPMEIIDIADPAIAKLYERRLVLVRPDGHVAWRGDTLPSDVEGLVDTVRGARLARSVKSGGDQPLAVAVNG